jgi:hypothetical protein
LISVSSIEEVDPAVAAARDGVRATSADGVNFIPYIKLLGVE